MKKLLLVLSFLLVGLLIGLLIASSIATSYFHSKFEREVSIAFKQTAMPVQTPISQVEIDSLPLPLQQYLSYTGVVGQPPIQFVRMRQQGQVKQAPDQPWTPMKAEQYCTTDPLFFSWYARIKGAPFLPVLSREIYYQGKGEMLIKLAGLVTLYNERGKDTNEGELYRYLSEMACFPTAFLHPEIQWDSLDTSRVRGTIRRQNVSASAVFVFAPDGRLLRLEAMRPYKADGKELISRKWISYLEDYQAQLGYKIPTKGKLCWDLDEQAFCYFEKEISDLAFNEPKIFQ